MARFKSPLVWLYSLGASVVGGAATSVTTWLGMIGAEKLGLNVPSLNWQAMGVICASGAATAFFAYLAKSPLPPLIEGDTTFINKPK